MSINEEVTIEIFGKPMPAMRLMRGLVSDLAEYQTAVEMVWHDANSALGCGELLNEDDLRVTLERIRVTVGTAMHNVQRDEEVRRTQIETTAAMSALAKCPVPLAGNVDGSAKTCVESGECACTVGEQY